MYVFIVKTYKKGKFMYDLTKNEELILLSIGKLSGDAYIVTIRKNCGYCVTVAPIYL